MDLILNSLNYQYKNFMVDIWEKYKFDLGVKGLSMHNKFMKKVKPTNHANSWEVEYIPNDRYSS